MRINVHKKSGVLEDSLPKFPAPISKIEEYCDFSENLLFHGKFDTLFTGGKILIDELSWGPHS